MSTAENRWALVTGSAQRIGRAIALELARGGWDIVVHYNASRDDALQTVKEIEALGRRAGLAEIDLADLPLVEKLIPALSTELGPIEALVNNASIFLPDAMTPSPAAHGKINAEAPRILSEAFYRQSIPGGVIVNILDADPSSSDFALYNASKKTLREMTIDMAKRFAPRVRVNGAAFGPVLRGPRESPEHFQGIVDKTPLKMSVGPENAARAVRFLVENPAVTGAIIPVDSGLHLKTA